MNQAMKITQSSNEAPVDLLFLIASVIKTQSRVLKQELLEINDFQNRLEKLNNLLNQEIEKS